MLRGGAGTCYGKHSASCPLHTSSVSQHVHTLVMTYDVEGVLAEMRPEGTCVLYQCRCVFVQGAHATSRTSM